MRAFFVSAWFLLTIGHTVDTDDTEINKDARPSVSQSLKNEGIKVAMMTTLVVTKNDIQTFLTKFINNIKTDEFKIEFDERAFSVRATEQYSVLDRLSSQAEDLGPEDLSANVDRYLYGLPGKN
ncbi:MAG: hypothetical protein BWK80_27040 [Desulfobacteraceae bacterium IS3]|nr:MAG: hypothetical protein BWK80_27040 [Desulfobacteraceae bacterium IS3]